MKRVLLLLALGLLVGACTTGIQRPDRPPRPGRPLWADQYPDYHPGRIDRPGRPFPGLMPR